MPDDPVVDCFARDTYRDSRASLFQNIDKHLRGELRFLDAPMSVKYSFRG